jgi:hypothetical protein
MGAKFGYLRLEKRIHRDRAESRGSDRIVTSTPVGGDARKGQEKGNALDACRMTKCRVRKPLKSLYLISLAMRLVFVLRTLRCYPGRFEKSRKMRSRSEPTCMALYFVEKMAACESDGWPGCADFQFEGVSLSYTHCPPFLNDHHFFGTA